MAPTITIGILEGSLRKASLSRAVARAACRLDIPDLELSVLPTPGGLPHFDQDLLDEELPRSVSELAAALRGVEAVLIVTPEYNWSIPGALKNAVDWISRLDPNPLDGKPGAIWTVSSGILGGARAHEPIRHVLHSQNMRVMAKPEVQIAVAKSKVDVSRSVILDGGTEDFLSLHLQAFSAFISNRRGPGT